MMIAQIRGADGAILGSHAVDPTAPGGLQAQLANLPRPEGPRVPMQQTQAAQVFLRYQLMLPGGGSRWHVVAISTPQGSGIPAGVYTHTAR